MREVPYAEFAGDPVWPTPAELQEMEIHGFMLRAERGALQRLVDARFNAPSEGVLDLRPLPLVLVSFGYYGRGTSRVPEFRRRGIVSYSEVATWLFLSVAREVPGLLPKGSLVVTIPYIYVDDDMALVAGRELYGFNKRMGTISMPSRPGEAAHYRLSTRGFRHVAPEALAEPLEPIEVLRTDKPSHEVASGPLESLGGLLRSARVLMVGGGPLLVGLGRSLGSTRVRSVLLKQTRDPREPERASVQQLLCVDSLIQRMEGQLLPGDYEVRLPASASEPVASELGLKERQPALTAFRVNMDAELGLSNVLWEARQGRG
jgi:hypothetical protein